MREENQRWARPDAGVDDGERGDDERQPRRRRPCRPFGHAVVDDAAGTAAGWRRRAPRRRRPARGTRRSARGRAGRRPRIRRTVPWASLRSATLRSRGERRAVDAWRMPMTRAPPFVVGPATARGRPACSREPSVLSRAPLPRERPQAIALSGTLGRRLLVRAGRRPAAPRAAPGRADAPRGRREHGVRRGRSTAASSSAARRRRRWTQADRAAPPPRPPSAPVSADLHRPGVAHGSTSEPVPPRSGTRPEGRLAHREPGVVGHDPQVAGQRELEAGADGVPLHRGDADDDGPGATSGEARLVGRDGRVERRLGSSAASSAEARARPAMPAGVKARRSSPAENDGPAAAQHDDRAACVAGPGPTAASARQVAGVWALRLGRRGPRRAVTGSRARPAAATIEDGGRTSPRLDRPDAPPRRCWTGGRVHGRLSALALAGVAPPRLRRVAPFSVRMPVHEAVRPPGLLGQGADARAVVVLLA